AGLVSIAPIVEGRVALHPESHASAHHLYAAHYLPPPGRRYIPSDRHVIGDLRDSVRREEPRDEDVRFRPIKLFVSAYFGHGRDLEISALLVIEDGGKDARGIEPGKTEPINRPIDSHQSHCLRVPDNSVVFYWLIGHMLSQRR